MPGWRRSTATSRIQTVTALPGALPSWGFVEMKFRVGALLMGALLIAAAPASAQEATATARTFAARAEATALQLWLGGEAGGGIKIGHTTAAMRSDTSVEFCEGEELTCATGAGEVSYNQAKAAHPGTASDDQTGGALPEELAPLLRLVVGEAKAQAAPTSAQGDAGLARLSLTATQTVAENIPQLQEGLREISNQILGPIAEGDPSGEVGPRIKQTVDYLVDNLSASPLVTLDVMPSHSRVSDDANVAMAHAVAKGIVLAISPTPTHTAIAPEGFIIVEVGVAEVTAYSDGRPSESDPAAVRISIFNPVTGEYDVIPVAAGDYICVAEDTPLQTCVGLGSAQAEAGAARSGGVTIDALEGNLVLEVGAAEVGASQAAAPAPGPAPVPEPAPAPLPTTGGGLALPALGLLGLGSLGAFGLRRRVG